MQEKKEGESLVFGQCIPLSAKVCVFSFYTACVRYQAIAAMVTVLLTGSIFLNIVCPHFVVVKWTVSVTILRQASERHIVLCCYVKNISSMSTA